MLTMVYSERRNYYGFQILGNPATQRFLTFPQIAKMEYIYKATFDQAAGFTDEIRIF